MKLSERLNLIAEQCEAVMGFMPEGARKGVVEDANKIRKASRIIAEVERFAEEAKQYEGATDGKWGWVICDHSMATLCADGDDAEKHIMSVSPCESCQKHALNESAPNKPDWNFGRCVTPRDTDADLICASVNGFRTLIKLLEGER